MTWTRGTLSQYDAWAQLQETSEASVGWNSTDMFRYMRKVEKDFEVAQNLSHSYCKAENFATPSAAQGDKGAQSISSYHGFTGPVHAGYPYNMVKSYV